MVDMMFVKDMSADFFSEVINVMVKYVDGGFFFLFCFILHSSAA